MLYGPHSKIFLSPTEIETVSLACSRELYDNASSGNYKTGDMKLAYEWYVLDPLLNGIDEDFFQP